MVVTRFAPESYGTGKIGGAAKTKKEFNIAWENADIEIAVLFYSHNVQFKLY